MGTVLSFDRNPIKSWRCPDGCSTIRGNHPPECLVCGKPMVKNIQPAEVPDPHVLARVPHA